MHKTGPIYFILWFSTDNENNDDDSEDEPSIIRHPLHHSIVSRKKRPKNYLNLFDSRKKVKLFGAFYDQGGEKASFVSDVTNLD
jgi:hypothetical protein